MGKRGHHGYHHYGHDFSNHGMMHSMDEMPGPPGLNAHPCVPLLNTSQTSGENESCGVPLLDPRENPWSDLFDRCKKMKFKKGKHFKHFKHWHQMRHQMSGPNLNKAQCSLCWRSIRPLVETEVLECGHLYHRLCLKELFAISQSGEQSEIFCTQCRQQIDTDLVTKLQNRFNGEPTTDPQSPGNQDKELCRT